MKSLKQLLQNRKRKSVFTKTDEKQKALIEMGNLQFKKLIERGIRIPVVLL